MRLDELPANLRPLADPAQEVLLDRRPAVRQLAPVPVQPTDADPAPADSWDCGHAAEQQPRHRRGISHVQQAESPLDQVAHVAGAPRRR